jgi:hypothetical protein
MSVYIAALIKYGDRSPKFIWAPVNTEQLYSLAEAPQPPTLSPRIWPHIRGRYWAAKIGDSDDISL